MPRPKPHYRLLVSNLQTQERLKIELIDLPFVSSRSFRLHVNGKWARKLPHREQDNGLAATSFPVGGSLGLAKVAPAGIENTGSTTPRSSSNPRTDSKGEKKREKKEKRVGSGEYSSASHQRPDHRGGFTKQEYSPVPYSRGSTAPPCRSCRL